jgi:tight adherence protein C
MMLPILIGGPVLYIVYGTDAVADWSPLKAYALAAGALVLSYKAPDLYLNNRIQKRSHAIRQALPDALDLLVICAEAGLTIDAAFARVAKELGRAYAELGEEFSLTAIELGFLTDRRQAFDNLATRIDLESIRGVATTMIQTEKYGTPLASSLRVLAAEFRHERMMRAEEKAARLPAIMTVPLILFILPVLFIVILGPAACSIHDTLMR